MGNNRSPRDSLKEMEQVDELHRRKLHGVGLPGQSPRRRPDKADLDQTENSHKELSTKVQESHHQISKESSRQGPSVSDTQHKCKPTSEVPVGVSKIPWSIYTYIPVIILVLATSVTAYVIMNKLTDNSDQFDNWFRQMENDFPEQYNFTWKTLNKSLNKFIKNGAASKEPTMIFMLGTADNRDAVNCLSDRVKTIVEDVYKDNDCLGIKSKELVKSNDTFLKLEMEKNMTHTLIENKCHALVIKDVDLLREAGLHFLQPYCDHENAPHKIVTIILTATTKRKLPTSLPNNKFDADRQFQKMAREHLDDAWKSVRSDYRDAWHSRFLQYVVVTAEVSRPTACANKKH